MSRPRRRASALPPGMPPALAVFRFEDWHDPAWDADYEPGGPFQDYLARNAWADARRSWLFGDDPKYMVKVPRPVAEGGANTSPVAEDPPRGLTPQVNRAMHHPKARVIKP